MQLQTPYITHSIKNYSVLYNTANAAVIYSRLKAAQSYTATLCFTSNKMSRTMQVMCMYLTCTLIWVGVTLIPDLYAVSMTHIGIWAALLCFVLFEGYGPLSGASMSAARTFAYFLAGGFTATRGRISPS